MVAITIIAWDTKTLASDSCLSTDNGIYIGKSKKLFRLKSGGMFGSSGNADARALISLLDNIKDENDMPSKQELEGTKADGSYLLVLPDKSTWVINIAVDEHMRYDSQAYPLTGKVAVGHGEDFATAAMSLGKTAEEAVKEACKWSLACRPPVQSMKLEDKPKEKIKRTRHPKQNQSQVEE